MTEDEKNADLIATAARVIGQEADALRDLAAALGAEFAAAVRLILAARGRVIVCGMGKSGHVARKIAATLASTGTPAHFLHPAEASHGDLGMLGDGDVALVLSNSGETPELADVITYTRARGIPLIGVAGRAESTLIRKSDIGLVLPPAPEACPMGLAPTTSTTMTLALGDAIAVALMQERGFTPDNFRAFHPGGKLGARLATVADLMHGDDELPLVAEDAPMTEALLVMSNKGFGVAGVTDRTGALIGVITDGDLRRHMDGLLSLGAAEVMTRSPITVPSQCLAEEALAIMNARKITTLFVVDRDRSMAAQGILHIHDCLRAGLG